MRSRGTVDVFLDAQSIGLKSRYSYAGVLRAFDAFVSDRQASTLTSMGTLRAWLQRDIQRSPLANVVQRASVIARYLDWRSAAGGRPHVLAQLRAQYGRNLAPIVQALLEDDYHLALQRLRPLKPWGSVLGLKPENGRSGPRVHDLRHTFVGHRMMQWYRDGVNPQSQLPHLSTYLGHKDISSTLAYLNISPELLEHASERYRRRNVGALQASGDRS